jgi:Uma2 family endonuclease
METAALAPSKAPRERRFTVEEYHRMGDAGILHEDDRVELLDGHLYVMSPIGSEHAACVRRLTRLFIRRTEPDALVSVQNPIRLDQASEPEPDLALLTPREDDYAARHPRPGEVLLVIEVADSSESFDRNTKHVLYARAGLPEYWVVTLGDNQMHVYRTPEDDQYTTHNTYGPDDEVTIAALPSIAPIPLNKILES